MHLAETGQVHNSTCSWMYNTKILLDRVALDCTDAVFRLVGIWEVGYQYIYIYT
jgi:hypothetical protein